MAVAVQVQCAYMEIEVGSTVKRKSDKKIAVIISVDLVRKTALMEFADGGTIVQTFPTVRNNWILL